MHTAPHDPPAEPLEGPPYVQVIDSRYCSSAWGENCCDLPNGHDGLHWDETNGNRWRAVRAKVQDAGGCAVVVVPRRWSEDQVVYGCATGDV